MERVGFLLSMAKGGAEVACGDALAPLELHVKQQGLLTILATEGPQSQQGIGSWMKMDRTTMVALVDSLEERGYVRRERNPDDRRAYLLQLTPSGRKIQQEAIRAMRGAEEEFLAALTPTERDELRDLLAKLVAAVGRPPTDPAPLP
jgi:DNA-binding MarR family transcriptional regulator